MFRAIVILFGSADFHASQITSLQDAGANVPLVAALPKFAAHAEYDYLVGDKMSEPWPVNLGFRWLWQFALLVGNHSTESCFDAVLWWRAIMATLNVPEQRLQIMTAADCLPKMREHGVCDRFGGLARWEVPYTVQHDSPIAGCKKVLHAF